MGLICEDDVSNTTLTCPSGDVIASMGPAFCGRSNNTTCPCLAVEYCDLDAG